MSCHVSVPVINVEHALQVSCSRLLQRFFKTSYQVLIRFPPYSSKIVHYFPLWLDLVLLGAAFFFLAAARLAGVCLGILILHFIFNIQHDDL